MRSLFGSPKAMRPVNLRRLPGELHSVAKQASFETQFFSSFGRFGGDSGGPKGGKNQLLRGFLSMFLFECVLASLFHCFFEGRTLDFIDFSAHTRCFMRFLLNRRFLNKHQKIIDFRSFLGGQNDEKSIKNRVRKDAFCSRSNFNRFLTILGRFWKVLGLQDGAKLVSKVVISSKGTPP